MGQTRWGLGGRWSLTWRHVSARRIWGQVKRCSASAWSAPGTRMVAGRWPEARKALAAAGCMAAGSSCISIRNVSCQAGHFAGDGRRARRRDARDRQRSRHRCSVVCARRLWRMPGRGDVIPRLNEAARARRGWAIPTSGFCWRVSTALVSTELRMGRCRWTWSREGGEAAVKRGLAWLVEMRSQRAGAGRDAGPPEPRVQPHHPEPVARHAAGAGLHGP